MTSNRKGQLVVVETGLELGRLVKTKYRDMTTDGVIHSFIQSAMFQAFSWVLGTYKENSQNGCVKGPDSVALEGQRGFRAEDVAFERRRRQ